MKTTTTGGSHRKIAPGPRGYPLLGVLPQIRQNRLQFFAEVARQYGDVVGLRLGLQRAYLINHPDHIKHVLQDNNHNYRKSRFTEQLKSVLGEGLVTSAGDFWRRQRRLMQPVFHHQRLAALASVMTDATAAMLARWQPVAERGVALVDRDGGELVGEASQRRIDRPRPKPVAEPVQRLAHHGRVLLAAIVGDDVVQHLVDQPQRVDLPGANSLLGEAGQVALRVHLLRERARGVEVGENNVAVRGEERLVELVSIAGETGDVEFQHDLPFILS